MKKTSLKKNIFLNYVGQGWSALMGFAFVPFYIDILGIESYGLIGIYALLQATLGVLEMGLSPALSREVARFSVGAHTTQSIRELLRTLETVYLVLAVSVPLLVAFGAHWMATNLINVGKLSVLTVTDAIVVMGIVIALRWWEGLYKGALVGFQELVWLNVVSIVVASLRWGGAAIILAFISPTIMAFFYFQAIVSLISTVIYLKKFYDLLPDTDIKVGFRLNSLKNIWGFSSGVMTITILTLLLTNTDKILLSYLLSLEQFGYYSLAVLVGGTLFQLIYPISNAVYPRLTALVASRDELGQITTYHNSCQTISILTVPIAYTLVFFGEPIVYLWTGNQNIALETAPIIAPLVLGTLFNGFINIPHMLQLAHGWTQLSVRVNIYAVLIIIPALILVAPKYGPQGAAYVWLALNIGYFLVDAHLMYRKILPQEEFRWYFFDVGLPLIAVGLAGLTLNKVIPVGLNQISNIMWILSALLVLYFIAIISSSLFWQKAFKFVDNYWKMQNVQ